MFIKSIIDLISGASKLKKRVIAYLEGDVVETKDLKKTDITNLEMIENKSKSIKRSKSLDPKPHETIDDLFKHHNSKFNEDFSFNGSIEEEIDEDKIREQEEKDRKELERQKY